MMQAKTSVPQAAVVPCQPYQPQPTAEQWKFQNDQLHASIQAQAQNALYSYHQTMADKLAFPIAWVLTICILTAAAVYLIRRAIAAGIVKNESYMKAEVEKAKYEAQKPEENEEAEY